MLVGEISPKSVRAKLALAEQVRAKLALAEHLATSRSELFGDRGGAEMARWLGVPVQT